MRASLGTTQSGESYGRIWCGGVSPTDHPNMVFLTAMARRKEGAAGVEARLHGGMAAIGIEEWVKYWSSKG